MTTLLTLTVHNHSGELFKGEAKAVSSHNKKGTFDVLPEHANYLTLIEKELTKEEKKFDVTCRMLSTVNNEVTILRGITFSL